MLKLASIKIFLIPKNGNNRENEKDKTQMINKQGKVDIPPYNLTIEITDIIEPTKEKKENKPHNGNHIDPFAVFNPQLQ